MTEDLQIDLDRLAFSGIIISFAYGPSGNKGILWWSVDVFTLKGEGFERPFMANSMEHCLEIAILECEKRGWLKGKV